MTVAVTNATDYLASHMLLALQDAGENWLALDNQGKLPEALVGGGEMLLDIDLQDTDALMVALLKHGIKEVVHFPSRADISQSVDDPLLYYKENTVDALSLVEACAGAGVERIVLSSSAAVYGVPLSMPIQEEELLRPISPYGASMTMAERIMFDVCQTNNIKLVTLRYFNVAGADPKGRAGEGGKPRHLIKVAAQIAVGVRVETLQIYGNDYDTPDGTCIRDYVHVSDIADAHLMAMGYLREGGGSIPLNCGYGYGASVLEVIAAVNNVTGKTLDTEIAPRRPGDPPLLIADTAAIRTVLDWAPRYDDVEFIVRTAIDWEAKLAKQER